MSLSFINGNDFVRMVKSGCIKLEHNRDSVDALNVFPVPDGDTGTNMYLTLLSAVKEGEKNQGSSLGKISKAISMGSLMGARGNSGVILSQVFRGIARSLEGKEKADAVELALALRTGSDTAYEAVMKPVEGTILTVIRETSRACENEAAKKKDIVATLMAGIQTGYAVLARTPSMLPILKEAGVVDAGGQGLLLFLEGALEGLMQDKEIPLNDYPESMVHASSKLSEARLDIEFQYCTEVLIKGEGVDLQDIKDHLGPLGDSMLVVGDHELVKVHIHSNHPGKVLESCLQWGALSDIKINNMKDEIHNHINNWEEYQAATVSGSTSKIGVVAVAAGDGIAQILKSLGVNVVVEGGQTMNPSTEDLLNACREVNAQSFIVLPNNSNVIMTALQLKQLCDKPVEIIPTRSVMQAITALIAFEPDGDLEAISSAMTAEIEQVKYAEITKAVRDSAINGLEIKTGDVIGILCDEVAVKAGNIGEVVDKLLEKMVDGDSQLITMVYGQDIDEAAAMEQEKHIQDKHPDCEIDFHYGGQPFYSYLISVE